MALNTITLTLISHWYFFHFQHFQEVEEEHICQMKDFIDTYAKAWENEHALRGQVCRYLFQYYQRYFSLLYQ